MSFVLVGLGSLVPKHMKTARCVQPCASDGPSPCPRDGHYQLNTQYAIDEAGVVVQKYHKMNLWVTEHQAYSKTGGEGTDPAPRGPELKYFDTRCGVYHHYSWQLLS
jgi:predicted amidohydrolase